MNLFEVVFAVDLSPLRLLLRFPNSEFMLKDAIIRVENIDGRAESGLRLRLLVLVIRLNAYYRLLLLVRWLVGTLARERQALGKTIAA